MTTQPARFQRMISVAVLFTPLVGCSPTWSVKIDPIAESGSHRISVTDARPASEKEFRAVDFAKLANKSYLGDVNIVPNRVSVFTARVNELAPLDVTTATVVLEHFDVLRDFSGSACNGCALAAVSYPAAIGASSNTKRSTDFFRCTIVASVNGVSSSGMGEAAYHQGAFENFTKSKSVSDGLQRCIDTAIIEWMKSAHLLP